MIPVLAAESPGIDWLQYGALGLLAIVLIVGGGAVLRYVGTRDAQLGQMHTATLDVVKSNTEAHVATREAIVALPIQIKSIVETSVRDELDRHKAA